MGINKIKRLSCAPLSARNFWQWWYLFSESQQIRHKIMGTNPSRHLPWEPSLSLELIDRSGEVDAVLCIIHFALKYNFVYQVLLLYFSMLSMGSWSGVMSMYGWHRQTDQHLVVVSRQWFFYTGLLASMTWHQPPLSPSVAPVTISLAEIRAINQYHRATF